MLHISLDLNSRVIFHFLFQMFITFHVAKVVLGNLVYQSLIIVLVKICRDHLILPIALSNA